MTAARTLGLLLLAGSADADPPPRVDLFAPKALAATQPDPPHGESSPATARLGEAERVSSGAVAPAWRDAQRRIAARFHPTVAEVADRPGAVAAADQALHVAPSQPSPQAPPTQPLDEAIGEQILASQEAADAPARWRDVAIDAEVDARGRLLAAKVTLPSGSAALDRDALESVRAALRSQPVVDPRGRVVARFRVAAARLVRLPRFTPVLAPGTGRVRGVTPQMPFSFDESTGHARPLVPFSQEVRTRVDLLWVAPAAR